MLKWQVGSNEVNINIALILVTKPIVPSLPIDDERSHIMTLRLFRFKLYT